MVRMPTRSSRVAPSARSTCIVESCRRTRRTSNSALRIIVATAPATPKIAERRDGRLGGALHPTGVDRSIRRDQVVPGSAIVDRSQLRAEPASSIVELTDDPSNTGEPVVQRQGVIAIARGAVLGSQRSEQLVEGHAELDRRLGDTRTSGDIGADDEPLPWIEPVGEHFVGEPSDPDDGDVLDPDGDRNPVITEFRLRSESDRDPCADPDRRAAEALDRRHALV